MSKFVRKEVRYRYEPAVDPMNSASHIQKHSVSVGQTYHLESDAQFKRDLEQSLAEIVTKRLQDAEDEAISLVKIAEQTAEANSQQIADEILAKANAQAKAMLETAQSQVDGIKEAAHEEGFKTGFQEGYADATAQVEQETVQLLQGVQMVTEKAYQAEKLVLKNFEKNAIALIEHLARSVVRRELGHSPEALLELVERAVESLYMSGKVKVVINPQILQDIRAYSSVTEEALARMNRFEFTVDPTLDLTQLFIIGEEGCFDLSPDTQISRLMEPLSDAFTLPRPEPESEAENPAEAEDPSVPDDEIVPAETASLEGIETEALETHEASSTPEAISPEVGPEAGPDIELAISSIEESAIHPDAPEASEADEVMPPAEPEAPEVKVFEFEEFGPPTDEESPS